MSASNKAHKPTHLVPRWSQGIASDIAAKIEAADEKRKAKRAARKRVTLPVVRFLQA